ncbi:LysR family transcriptional regulator [Ferrimonas balearica]|uniref:LysR family transcriptional regulator n=1 Tax=Ferrimonas balearica TaxID=44012 RepID=UPI001C9A11CF|nr:LysR family transcriptional regulator [Ferrimonas balearica]MBY5992375.1 LysR family transcriptional regulator [Ferrimonas balearica]
MRPDQLDLNLLKVFEALYREGNVSAAAQALHVTPSAVSHALKRLRTQLGEPLFERQGNGMRPTPSCQRMAPLLLDQLAQLRQLLQAWGHFTPAEASLAFRLGIPDALEPLVVPALARTLMTEAPHSTLTSARFDRQQLVRELAQGQVDLAVDVRLAPEPELCHQALLEDELVVLSDVALTALDRTTYQHRPHVVVSSRPRGRVLEALPLAEQGVERRVTIRCQNHQTAATMVAGTDYLLTLPRRIAEPLVGPQCRLHPLPVPLPPVQIHLYWHQRRDADPALVWLRQRLASSLERGPGAAPAP